MSVKTSDVPHGAAISTPWILSLSNGGLCVPSKKLLELVFDLHDKFCQFHGHQSLRKEPCSITNFFKGCCTRYPEVDEKILFLISKTFTHIRLKYINRLLREKMEAEKIEKAKKRLQKKQQGGQEKQKKSNFCSPAEISANLTGSKVPRNQRKNKEWIS